MDTLHGNEKSCHRRYSLYTPPISSRLPVKTFYPTIRNIICALLEWKVYYYCYNGKHRVGKRIGSQSFNGINLFNLRMYCCRALDDRDLRMCTSDSAKGSYPRPSDFV